MKLFSELINVRKDVTVGDVHVSTALGNEDDDERKKKRPVRAFVGQPNVRQVVPEERGPATNAEQGSEGQTLKRYATTADLPAAVKNKLKGKKRRQWMHVWNSAYNSHGDEGRAFAEAWSTVKKRKDRPLYIKRPLINGHALRAWALDQGFETTLDPDEMHVTIVRSDEPLDWDTLGEVHDWQHTTPPVTGKGGKFPSEGLTYTNGHDAPSVNSRSVGQMGTDGAVVLRFEDPYLCSRHEDLVDAGAEWPHPNFKPHVTITYGSIPAGVEPYVGVLSFGPEEWDEADPNWAPNYVEKRGVKKSDILSAPPMVGVGGRRLEPFDEGTFFVPFKYDPSALSSLRVDQVPRVLDALTHPEYLQRLSLPISDLVAVKGRVSREVIQKHLDAMAARPGSVHHGTEVGSYEGSDDLDPPVVVYYNGAFVLLDGHDRTTAMWLDGIDVIDVAFENVDAVDNRKPDPDDTHRNTAYALLHGVDGRTLTNYVDSTCSVPFMVDEQFFSHLRPDQVPKFIYAVTHPDKLGEATLSLSTLVAIQNRVNVDTVAGKVEKPSKKLPVITRMNGVNYIADGHDRLTARWLRGDDQVQVKLTDITWADNTMRPNDLVKAAETDRRKAAVRLREADRYAREIIAKKSAAEAEAVAKRVEAAKIAEAAEAEAVAKRAEAEALVAKAKVEAERYEVEARKAADDYVRYMAEKKEKVNRKAKVKKTEIDDALIKKARQSDRDVDEKMATAESYLKYIARAKDELDDSVLKMTKKAEKYAAQKYAEADQYELDKRLKADQYDIDKRLEADRYAAEKLLGADRYEIEKKIAATQYESEKLRGLSEVAKVSHRGSLLKSGDAQMKIDIRKVNKDKQQIFGWASIVKKDGKMIIDKQGDVIPVEELETAVYDYMLRSRDGGHLHVMKGVSTCIESMMFTEEKQEALGIDLGLTGWWVGYAVNSDEMWDAVKKGEILQFSIGGQAVSTNLED